MIASNAENITVSNSTESCLWVIFIIRLKRNLFKFEFPCKEVENVCQNIQNCERNTWEIFLYWIKFNYPE